MTVQGCYSSLPWVLGMLPVPALRLPAPVFSQTLPAQIKSPLYGCNCPVCTGIALASSPSEVEAAAAHIKSSPPEVVRFLPPCAVSVPDRMVPAGAFRMRRTALHACLSAHDSMVFGVQGFVSMLTLI